MAFPPSFIDELLARNPIEEVVGQYVTLKRSGSNMFGLCPFHGEKTASFSVAPEKGIYYCFGCHKVGGAINFMMELEGLSYPENAPVWRCRRMSSIRAVTGNRNGSGHCTRKLPGFSILSCTPLWAGKR